MIIYNDKDITSSVHPLAIHVIDRAGGRPDGISLVFSDTEGLWSKWKPAKGDTIQIKEKSFDSGVMWIDQITQTAGKFMLQALSIPQASRSARSQGWEDVRFMEFVTQIAARHGFEVKTYNVINHHYDRIDQQEMPDFAFLAGHCALEGYALKIHNRAVVIYDEALEEQKPADSKLAIIRKSDINGSFEFVDKSTDVYEKCIVRSMTPTGYIEGEYKASSISGPTLKQNLYATNQAEANRWAKGTLRSFNKQMVAGSFSINLNPNYAAGINVMVQETGMFDGKYFIDMLVHDLINNRTKLSLRRPLEGY